MTEVFKNLTVDLSRKGGSRPIFAVENDTGSRKLRIRITDDGSHYALDEGTVAILNYKRADGVSGALLADTGDDGVLATLTPSVLGASGQVICSVSLVDEKKNKITSSEFCLDVSEELYSGEELDTAPEFGLLVDTLSRLSGIESEESAREKAEDSRKEAEYGREEAETERREAELIREKRISGRLGDGGSVTLVSSKWSSENTQTLTIEGLRDDDMVIFYPATANDREYCGIYRVFISPESDDNGFGVTARAKPTEDISLKYYVIRGRLPEEVD